jgi:hypothetical protein
LLFDAVTIQATQQLIDAFFIAFFGIDWLGFPKGKAEWTLWGGGICDGEHVLINALPVADNAGLVFNLLLHGGVSPRLCAFPVLCAVSVRLRARGGGDDDGHCKRRPQFPDGHHHRSWNPGSQSVQNPTQLSAFFWSFPV